jgi:hypothetical protein
MWEDCDDILVMLGEAITVLRDKRDLEDYPEMCAEVANDLALVHATVSARWDMASSDRSPAPAPSTGRGEGAAHLTLIRGGG